MTDRAATDALLRELYEARIRGDLDGVLRTFASDAKLEIAGATYATPMNIRATGSAEIRTWLALLVKSFQVSEQEIISLIIDGDSAAVQWRARVRSRITGATVPSEFIDVIRIRDGRIVAYTEFFVPLG